MKAQMRKIEDNHPKPDSRTFVEITEPCEANSVFLKPGEVKTVLVDRRALKVMDEVKRISAARRIGPRKRAHVRIP